jgi:hypothetical protein
MFKVGRLERRTAGWGWLKLKLKLKLKPPLVAGYS